VKKIERQIARLARRCRALRVENRILVERLRRAASSAGVIRREKLHALGELAGGIAHDMNNVLGALKLRVAILVRDPACVAAQAANLGSIERILDDGLALGSKLQRLGEGRRESYVLVELAEVIRAAAEIAESGLRHRAAETGAQIRIRCDIGLLPKVLGDPDELQRVFVNLLINARDAMPGGGTISVGATVHRREVVIKVEDEGCGIAPRNLPRIFDPFFTTKGSKGSGLGLAVAKSVMGQVGGSIIARNRAAGGTCFELRFPQAHGRRTRAGRLPAIPGKAIGRAENAGRRLHA